jgi:hypothetical protein
LIERSPPNSTTASGEFSMCVAIPEGVAERVVGALQLVHLEGAVRKRPDHAASCVA